MRGIDVELGLKARNVTARPEGPGRETATNVRGQKGRRHRRAIPVPALQAGKKFVWTCSRAFSPGYHIAGFQPYTPDMLKCPHIFQRGNVNKIIGKFGRADQLHAAVNLN